MKISLRPLAIALTVILWLALPVYSPALPSIHELAQAVNAHYNRLRTLRADFVEIYQGAGTARTESGTLWLKKPGKMRWEYRSPQEKLFVGDGHDAWLYLPDDRQARKSSMKDLEDLRSPLGFLLGRAHLEKELRGLSFAPDMVPSSPGNSMIRGVPAGLEERVNQVALEITPEYRIVRILIQGSDESLTEYRFSNQEENLEVPDGKFRFSPPSGTEVIATSPSD